MKTIEKVREEAATMLAKLHEAQNDALTAGKNMKVEVEQGEKSVTITAKVYTEASRYSYDAKYNFSFVFNTDDTNNDEFARLQAALTEPESNEE